MQAAELALFYVIEKCCNVVEVFAAEQTLLYVIRKCCNIVVVKQEFRQKFLLVFAAEQTLFYIDFTQKHQFFSHKRNKLSYN